MLLLLLPQPVSAAKTTPQMPTAAGRSRQDAYGAPVTGRGESCAGTLIIEVRSMCAEWVNIGRSSRPGCPPRAMRPPPEKEGQAPREPAPQPRHGTFRSPIPAPRRQLDEAMDGLLLGAGSRATSRSIG